MDLLGMTQNEFCKCGNMPSLSLVGMRKSEESEQQGDSMLGLRTMKEFRGGYRRL